jgi:hypothetical protein
MEIEIDIDEDLLAQTKVLAERTGKTVSKVVEEALRQKLSLKGLITYPPQLPLSDKSGGLQPGVDISNSAALLDILDGDDPVHKLR